MNLLNRVLKISVSMISLLVIGACSVVPKKLDSLGQDDGHQFVREVLARKTDSLFDQLNTSDLAVEQALHFFHQTMLPRFAYRCSSGPRDAFGKHFRSRLVGLLLPGFVLSW